MEKIFIEPINIKVPLRNLIFDHFKSLSRELPIKGGWGYTKEDAIIIDKNDHTVDSKVPFDGVGLEYIIAEKRIYEELIIQRPEDDRFSGIRWNLLSQDCIHEGDRIYDNLVFKVTAHREKDFEELKNIWESNLTNPKFETEEHLKKHEELLCHYESEYWFDITSFYGKTKGIFITINK